MRRSGKGDWCEGGERGGDVDLIALDRNRWFWSTTALFTVLCYVCGVLHVPHIGTGKVTSGISEEGTSFFLLTEQCFRAVRAYFYIQECRPPNKKKTSLK